VKQTPNPASGQRVALVIGNGAYKDSPLPNPTNDARDIARMLRGIGFDVIQRENATKPEMKESIRAFGQRIQKGGTGLFYYAGHATQINGKNFLIPIAANINHEFEVEDESVDLDFVLGQMKYAQNPTNIVILDACRNNPLARGFRSASRGLAYVNAPQGTIIEYATAPGETAIDGDDRNSPYTQELLRYITEPDIKIEDTFKRVRLAVRQKTGGKQIPWEASSLVGDFFFLKSSSDSVPNSRVYRLTDIFEVSVPSYWTEEKTQNGVSFSYKEKERAYISHRLDVVIRTLKSRDLRQATETVVKELMNGAPHSKLLSDYQEAEIESHNGPGTQRGLIVHLMKYSEGAKPNILVGVFTTFLKDGRLFSLVCSVPHEGAERWSSSFFYFLATIEFL
jgi:hypothetical protein